MVEVPAVTLVWTVVIIMLTGKERLAQQLVKQFVCLFQVRHVSHEVKHLVA
jgi:hypothetical protein